MQQREEQGLLTCFSCLGFTSQRVYSEIILPLRRGRRRGVMIRDLARVRTAVRRENLTRSFWCPRQ